MNNITKQIIAGIVVLVVGVLIGRFIMPGSPLGGLVHNQQEIFSAGIKAGSAETEVIDSSGVWKYQIDGTTGAFSSTLNVTGNSTFVANTAFGTTTAPSTATVEIIESGSYASTTIGIGNAYQTGCIIMGDNDGAGVSYIYSLDGTLYATSVQPSICK